MASSNVDVDINAFAKANGVKPALFSFGETSGVFVLDELTLTAKHLGEFAGEV